MSQGPEQDFLQTDALLFERRERRRIGMWRAVALTALAVMGVMIIGQWLPLGEKHIARLNLEGFIGSDPERLELIKEIAEDENALALIVRINSPGGSTAASEALFESLRVVALQKPVVAVMSEVAASGGYIAALACDHIVARRTTITGSIGVLFQWFEVTGLLDKAGVAAPAVRSGELKARPNPFEKAGPRARQVAEEAVDDSFEWFVGLVVARRNLEKAEVLRLADGRIFTGGQAHKNGLIDAIGGEAQARKWLENRNEDISPDTLILDRDPNPESWDSLGGAMIRLVGLLTNPQNLAPQPGLMAIWRPGN